MPIETDAMRPETELAFQQLENERKAAQAPVEVKSEVAEKKKDEWWKEPTLTTPAKKGEADWRKSQPRHSLFFEKWRDESSKIKDPKERAVWEKTHPNPDKEREEEWEKVEPEASVKYRADWNNWSQRVEGTVKTYEDWVKTTPPDYQNYTKNFLAWEVEGQKPGESEEDYKKREPSFDMVKVAEILITTPMPGAVNLDEYYLAKKALLKTEALKQEKTKAKELADKAKALFDDKKETKKPEAGSSAGPLVDRMENNLGRVVAKVGEQKQTEKQKGVEKPVGTISMGEMKAKVREKVAESRAETEAGPKEKSSEDVLPEQPSLGEKNPFNNPIKPTSMEWVADQASRAYDQVIRKTFSSVMERVTRNTFGWVKTKYLNWRVSGQLEKASDLEAKMKNYDTEMETIKAVAKTLRPGDMRGKNRVEARIVAIEKKRDALATKLNYRDSKRKVFSNELNSTVKELSERVESRVVPHREKIEKFKGAIERNKGLVEVFRGDVDNFKGQLSKLEETASRMPWGSRRILKDKMATIKRDIKATEKMIKNSQKLVTSSSLRLLEAEKRAAPYENKLKHYSRLANRETPNYGRPAPRAKAFEPKYEDAHDWYRDRAPEDDLESAEQGASPEAESKVKITTEKYLTEWNKRHPNDPAITIDRLATVLVEDKKELRATEGLELNKLGLLLKRYLHSGVALSGGSRAFDKIVDEVDRLNSLLNK